MPNYGWQDSTIYSIADNQLTFTGSGTAINAQTQLYAKNKVTVEAVFTFKSVDLGLILWYNDLVGYITFSLSLYGLRVNRIYKGNTISLKNLMFSDTVITPPVTDDIITLRAELYGTNIKCYYNGAMIFNLEQNTFTGGMFGIHGETGTICSSFKVQSETLSSWTRSIGNGAIINTDAGIKIICNDNSSTCISQAINTTIGSTYTVSVENSGETFIEAYDGTNIIATVTSTSDGILELQFTATTVSTQIRIGRKTVGECILSRPQVEEKSFKTSYTKTTRGDSKLSFPAGRLDRNVGGLALWIKPLKDYSDGEVLPIFYYSDALKVIYQNGNVQFTYGDYTKNYAYILAKDKDYHIIATWNNDSDYSITVYDADADTENGVSETILSPKSITYSDNIMIGCSLAAVANAIVDTLVVYSGPTTLDDMRVFRTEPAVGDNRVVIQTDFNNDTLIFSKNKIIVPNPKPGSPILLEDSNGVSYERVYFLYNGEYVIFDTKKFVYTDSKTFKVNYDVLCADAHTEDGTKTFSNVIVSGRYITVDNLTDEDIGKTIIIEYTPRNAFCANYNIESGGYEIEVSNVDGNEITITYENKEGSEIKFIGNVEANPFKASNNNGFIYVTDLPQEAVSLDVKITPQSVIADGYQVVTISVDCLAKNGVPTGNVDLTLSNTKYGTLTRYQSNEESEFITNYGIENLVTDEQRSGRFIYKYRVNNIAVGGILMERLVITDRKSGIGTEVPIKIVSKT